MTGTVRRRFRPRLWPSVITAAMLIVLLGLGTWQLERRAWKNALIAQFHDRSAAPAVVLPARIGDPAAWEFRRVRVEGRFDHGHEMALIGRVHDGQAGYRLVTPLHRTDHADAPVVLVDRGWIPSDRLDPATRPDSRPAGPVEVEGVALHPVAPGWFRPSNDPARGQWYTIDLPAMAAWSGAGEVGPLYVEATPRPGRPPLPVASAAVHEPPNDHLNYALTWYGLAAALVLVYTLSQRRADPPARPQ